MASIPITPKSIHVSSGSAFSSIKCLSNRLAYSASLGSMLESQVAISNGWLLDELSAIGDRRKRRRFGGVKMRVKRSVVG